MPALWDALRAERKHLVRLLTEQEKTLVVYRHQADWLRREDVALLIEKKNVCPPAFDGERCGLQTAVAPKAEVGARIPPMAG